MLLRQLPHIREHLPRFTESPTGDETAGGFGEDEEGGEKEKDGGDDLQGEDKTPLGWGGGRDVFVYDVIDPV